MLHDIGNTWFDVKSSGVEAHSLPHEGHPFATLTVPLVAQVHENWPIHARTANCMQQAETLLQQFLPTYHSDTHSLILLGE